MNSICSRKTLSLAATLLALALNVAAAEQVDPTVQALRALDSSVASNQLEQAERQLQALQKSVPGDTRLEQARREISAAYVRQGDTALNSGNLTAASQALSKAQRAMPVGNQKAAALASSIKHSQEQQAAAQQALAAQTEAAEQQRQQKLAAERKAAAAKKAEAAAAAAAAAKPKVLLPKLIDPTAASSTIALPMLDNKDKDDLRKLLDQLAPEVVALNCKVKIEVPLSKDYPWVAALLSARVKKIDPGFALQLEPQINPDNPPQLVLTPQG